MFVLEQIISTLAPHNCLVCGAEGSPLCSWCFEGNLGSLPPRCYKCFSATENSRVCAKCRKKTPLKHVWVYADYSGLPKVLLKSYKFERKQALAPTLAEYIKTCLPYLGNYVLVPIPPATSRLRKRGYDHTHLIAKALAGQSNLRCYPALSRLGQTRQVGTKKDQRVKQISGAFRLKNNFEVKKENIILLDDVVTTGATLEEAARVLIQAGAKTVDAVVFAQKH